MHSNILGVKCIIAALGFTWVWPWRHFVPDGGRWVIYPHIAGPFVECVSNCLFTSMVRRALMAMCSNQGDVTARFVRSFSHNLLTNMQQNIQHHSRQRGEEKLKMFWWDDIWRTKMFCRRCIGQLLTHQFLDVCNNPFLPRLLSFAL